MSTDLYRQLTWLLPCPDDFNRQCRAALESSDKFGIAIRNLARFAMDDNQLIRLAKTIGTAREKGCSFAPLAPFRLGLATNGTSELIRDAVIATSPRHGLSVECAMSGYDQALQDSLSPDSPLSQFQPEAVLIAMDWRGLRLSLCPGDKTAARNAIDAALDSVDAIREAVRRNSGAVCIVQNLAPPPETVFGSMDRWIEGTMASLIDGFNAGLSQRLRGSGSGDVLFDVAGLAATVGVANWHSAKQWNMAKLPFDPAFLPLYADHVCRILAALRGLSRRCLVLDLDNTLWGGVIGDDGLGGIHVSQGDPEGEAYLSFQQYILALRKRGIVLAVSSKNEDETARLPFQKSPDMLLREEDFAVFQANWKDKASNIQAIADTLALGLDSFVFADDNPFERNIVREALPGVAVPEMPADPSEYARTLSAAGYFEAVAFSEEDQKRAAYYTGNAQRANLERQAGDVNAYLASLEMEIEFQPFDDTGRSRIAQLINKSNQFNLTTRRYTESEVASFIGDPDLFTLQVRLRDKLGDNGMISVVIGRRAEPSVWEIDTWLMSCRVLGRRVEEAVLLELLDHAKRQGSLKLRGLYRPTGRNKLVEHHYSRLGFTLAGNGEDGSSIWELDVRSASLEPPPMAVRRPALDPVPVQDAR